MASPCTSVVPPVNTVVVNMDSSWFNVLNFVAFDIVLASLVFYLTGDVAGLSNSTSAVRQLSNQLYPYNPPFVGVGLTCTRKNVYRILAFVRGLTMVLVLATNFLIEGSSCANVEKARANVLVPKYVNASSVILIDVWKLMLRRRGCQGRKGDLVYYGESREGQGCELREDLFSFPTVYYGLRFTNATVIFKEPCEFYTNNSTAVHIHQFTCPDLGTIACRNRDFISSLESSCVGIVNVRGSSDQVETHMCQGEALFPGRNAQNRTRNRVARCRLARNLNARETNWVPLLYSRVNTLRDLMDAIYGSGYQEMEVKVTPKGKIRRQSGVHISWFIILGLTLLILTGLISIDLFLRYKGHVPVANSEYGLASLITTYDEANEIMAEEELMPRMSRVEPQDNNIDDEVENEENRRMLFVENHDGVLRARSSSK